MITASESKILSIKSSKFNMEKKVLICFLLTTLWRDLIMLDNSFPANFVRKSVYFTQGTSRGRWLLQELCSDLFSFGIWAAQRSYRGFRAIKVLFLMLSFLVML